MSILVFSVSEDFLFEDDNKNLYFLKRDVLDRIAEDLKLNYFASVINGNAIKEVYYDKSANSAIVFNYRMEPLSIMVDKCLVSLYCFLIDENIEIYEDSRHYFLNIHPLLQPYIRNEKIFQIIENMISNFIDNQKYVV